MPSNFDFVSTTILEATGFAELIRQASEIFFGSAAGQLCVYLRRHTNMVTHVVPRGSAFMLASYLITLALARGG
jgi:hypothetical protein